MSELKPCPFCGAENTDVGFIAHTDDCYLMRRYIGASSRRELGIAWNIRPIEDALRAELARRDEHISTLIETVKRLKEDGDRMSETKFVFCENCKRVFEMDAVSHIKECPACDVPNPMPEIPECVASELASRDEIIARLKEDGERLASVDEFQEICPFCDNCDGYGYRKPEDVPDGEEYTGEYPEHSSDCPITLHRALMKELE